MSETPWLDAEEQALWRRWMSVQALQPVALGRGLAEDSGLSPQDYVVLVELSEHPQERMRVTQLAERLAWERSRVSHQVTRMTRRGLLERGGAEDDGRGSAVVLTVAGRTAIESAAPGHVRLVRRILFDVLDDRRRAVLASVLEDVHDALTRELGRTSGSDVPARATDPPPEAEPW